MLRASATFRAGSAAGLEASSLLPIQALALPIHLDTPAGLMVDWPGKLHDYAEILMVKRLTTDDER